MSPLAYVWKSNFYGRSCIALPLAPTLRQGFLSNPVVKLRFDTLIQANNRLSPRETKTHCVIDTRLRHRQVRINANQTTHLLRSIAFPSTSITQLGRRASREMHKNVFGEKSDRLYNRNVAVGVRQRDRKKCRMWLRWRR